jgi:hypothetical protein
VTITSPKTGSSVSLKRTPTLSITGGATFAAVSTAPTSTKFYLRRDGCGTATDNTHLSVTAGAPDAGDGCGIVGGQGITGIAAPGLTGGDYPTVDGMPISFDATKTIDGVLDVNSDVDGVGQITIDFSIEALVNGEGVVVGSDSETITVDPTTSEYTVPFSITPDASLDGANLSGLDLHLNESGPYVGSGYVGLSGKSYLTVAGHPPANVRAVQLSLDDASFSNPIAATLNSSFTGYTASVATPAVGKHTLYARATQNGTTSAVASSAFKVTK